MRDTQFVHFQFEWRRSFASRIAFQKQQQSTMVGLQESLPRLLVQIQCDPVFEDRLRRKFRSGQQMFPPNREGLWFAINKQQSAGPQQSHRLCHQVLRHRRRLHLAHPARGADDHHRPTGIREN